MKAKLKIKLNQNKMENKTIPTAEEFLRKNIDYVLEKDCKEDVENAMKEFAKLHVEAALIEVFRITHKNGIPRIVDDKDSILNSYPLENIN